MKENEINRKESGFTGRVFPWALGVLTGCIFTTAGMVCTMVMLSRRKKCIPATVETDADSGCPDCCPKPEPSETDTENTAE